MKKGFTLIELLAVIVILAIIALIATPIVLNIIDDSKESSILRSAEMYLNAVEYAIADIVTNKGGISTANYYITEEGNLCEQELVNNKCPEEEIEIKVKGEKPKSGKIEIKGIKINTAEVVLSEKTIQKTEEGKIVLKEDNQSKEPVCTLASDSEKTGTELGAKYECEVKPGTKYNFYVLSNNEEDGTTNLILDRNINSDGTLATKAITKENAENGVYNLFAWISKEDYNDDANFGKYGNSNKGPITAMKFLNEATSKWSNIPNLDITYDDEGGNFTNFEITGKARMPYLSEVNEVGCEDSWTEDNEFSCPLWMVEYLSDAKYFFETEGKYQQYPIDGITGYYTLCSEGIDLAYGVEYIGIVEPDYIDDAVVMRDYEFGVRPVITIKL